MLLKKLCLIATVALSLTGSVFAAELPYTDVTSKDPWYNDVSRLYEQGIISDDGSHLFRPTGLIQRDEFVGIVVGVGCKKCLSPTAEDILKYRTSPFLDLTKSSKYFYCVSYAKEKGIIEGYRLDKSGTTSCQNGTSYNEVPFCGANNISRIEAAAVLLRQANYWNKTLDSSGYLKTITITDVDDFWYGYAQKALQVGLIKIDEKNQIHPNEFISRREFAQMAAKILSANLCELTDVGGEENDFAADIKILDKTNVSCGPVSKNANTIATETTYDFFAYVPNAKSDFTYDWTFTNPETGESVSASGQCLDNKILQNQGTWLIKLVTTDPQTQKSVTSYSQVYRGDPKNGLIVNIEANPLIWNAPITTDFKSLISGGVGPFTYRWDFWDEAYSSDANPSHTYPAPWIYTVTLTVRDANGNTGYATLTVEVRENNDLDNDGVLNFDDLCINVYGPASNQWCPVLSTFSSSMGNFSKCITDKAEQSGLITGKAACSSCPCTNTVQFASELRECDIVFPAILSPDKNTIYSRWSIFEIRK